ncbi:MAG: sensor domain-containing diguanylate cyclase [bacterium]|nr:sensor domain-containing diguanylate cyclase [bacterium]
MNCCRLRDDLLAKLYRRRGRLLAAALAFLILLAAGFFYLASLSASPMTENGLSGGKWLSCVRTCMPLSAAAAALLLLFYILAVELAETSAAKGGAPDENEGERTALRAKKYMEALTGLYDRYYEFDLTNNKIIAGSGHFQKHGLVGSDHRQTIVDFCQRNVHPDDRELYLRFALPENNKEAFERGVTGANIEYRTLTPDGSAYRWKSAVNNVFVDTDDMTLRSLWFISDITGAREKTERLSLLAERDSLTGLYNKIYIQKAVEKKLRSQRESGASAALIMVDLDNFKNVNDLMGHLFGDTLLVSVAQTLSGIFKDGALLGRVGGDEFLIFIPDAGEDKAREKAQEACGALSSIHKNYFDMLRLSASIGVALFPRHGDTFPELYNKADIALYHAKECGRARCKFYHESMGDAFPRMTAAVQSNTASSDLFAKDPARHIFRILYGAKNNALAVHGTIELIVRRFRFSRGYIFRNSDDNRYFSEIYEFCNDGVAATGAMFQNRSYEEERPNYLSNFNEDGIFWMELDNVDARLHETFRRQDIYTLVQIAIMDNGEFKGFLGFDCCDPSRMFSREERSVIEETGMVIASFVLKIFLGGSLPPQ